MSVPSIDKAIGIEVYGTDTAGIGGVIRESVKDFLVEEVLVDGSVAGIEKSAESRALGASANVQPNLLCVLVKRNWDTFMAVKNIAKQLGISQSQIHIGGIKDARAVTAQHITIENVTMEDISRLNLKDIEVRAIGYFRDSLSPYYLLGNKFKIRIKKVRHSKTSIEKRIAKTTENLERTGGIPNFFGHQRFGTTRPITHLVGKAILKGNFEEAAMIFLSQPTPYEHPESSQARKELREKRDFKQALRDFPRQLRYERLMLRRLAEESFDFVGAFERLPERLRELFVQAYQSYLFNRFLSERLRNGFALNRAEVGDFVVRVDRSGLPIVRTGKIAEAESLSEIHEQVEAGRMRVALSLVGMKQKLSEGAMGQLERDVLEKEDVDSLNFRVDALPRMSARGELRAVVSPIRELQSPRILDAEADPTSCQVELEFMLLRGSYATMLLREVMKPRDPIAAGF